jgi:hypothetical protein
VVGFFDAYRSHFQHVGQRVEIPDVNLNRGQNSIMTNHLQELVEAARRTSFPSEEREAQRRSFAYGNTNIENELITRKMVDEQAEALSSANQSK